MANLLRNSIFYVTKKRTVSNLLERTVTQAKKADDEYDYPEDLPQVLLNRPKAASGRNRENVFARLSLSLFGQLFEELHFIDPSLLRLGYTHPMDDGQERTFKVKFEGEGVDDYGGPYREIFGQLAGELQMLVGDVGYLKNKGGRAVGAGVATDQSLDGGNRLVELKCMLPLLCPTRNWRVETGEDVGGEERRGRNNDSNEEGDSNYAADNSGGRFVPNPDLTNHIYLEMFSFLGKIIGVALRSRICTKFRFPPFVWKAIVGEKADAEDLKTFDEAAFSVAKEVLKMGDEISAAITFVKLKKDIAKADKEKEVRDLAGKFTSLTGEIKWVTTLSNGKQENLCKNGFDRLVTVDNYKEFVHEMVQCRLHESDTQLKAIRGGFVSIVPDTVLPLLSCAELELLVCGKEGVDIDLLQENTEYDDDVSPDDEHILSFWRVMRGFDDDDRSQLLKFVWARERLPNSSAEFHQRFKIQASARPDPDTYLPKAHTCFFSLNLPRYSTDEVMKEKLLYAIYNCIEMDADFKLADSENSSWG